MNLNLPPKKLAVYLGIPVSVNNSTSVSQAVQEFNNYDLVVFGKEQLSNISNPNNMTTKIIINQTNADVFGYVDGTRQIGNFKNYVNQWKLMGVKGIFIDKFGYDDGNTRKDQKLRINYVHGMNLLIMATCNDPDDLFAYDPFDPPGLSEMTANDYYLAKGYQIKDGNYVNVNDWLTLSNKMKNYREVGPGYSKMLTLGTVSSALPNYDQNRFDYVYYSTALYGFDGCGWGELNLSEGSNQLPYRMRKSISGNKLLGDIFDENPIFYRNTNGGISINTITHEICNIFKSTN